MKFIIAMNDNNSIATKFSIHSVFWPIYFLGGFQILAFSGIYISVLPLSLIFWPNDPYHALEMGIMITSMFWIMSISGIFFGRLIDKYNRKLILSIVGITRGLCMTMLSLTMEGKGMESWSFFYIFVFLQLSF